jgi:hypothetical protein
MPGLSEALKPQSRAAVAQAAPKAVAGPPPAPRQEARPAAQAPPAQANGPKQPVSAKASAKSNDEEWWTE